MGGNEKRAGNLQHISEAIRERNITLSTTDPVARGGFTQVPNFILNDPSISLGAKVTYAKFLQYAWHNESCFPGQQRLSDELGMSVGSINTFVKELEKMKMLEIHKRGQGKTNVYNLHFRVRKK